MAALGLERGVEGSVATHQEVKRWYARGQEVSQEVTQQIATAVEIDVPGTVVPRPREYARQQHDRVVEALAPQMEALAHQARQLTFKVERQELQIAAQAEREQASKAMLAHLRQVNLGTVMTALGGSLDRDDWRRWHLGDEVIAINGEQFHSLTSRQGGKGAIELVMHARPGYDFEEAVVFLSRRVGADVAVVAAARHAQGIAGREASRTAEPVPERTVWEHKVRASQPLRKNEDQTTSVEVVEIIAPEERVRRIRSALDRGDRPTAESHFAMILQESSPSTERWLRRVIAQTPTLWNASAYPVSEDLRQELALEVWKRLADPNRREMAWESTYWPALIYAQRHVATRYMREAGYWVDTRALAEGWEGLASRSVACGLVEGAEAPDTLTVAGRAVDVYSMVMRLPPKERAAVVFRYWRGMKERDIARELRCTDRTVRTLLQQARGRMGTWYEGNVRTAAELE